MTTPQEAQQAQTIAKAKANAAADVEWLDKPGYSTLGEAVKDRAALLEIVDSQAQKIAEQAEDVKMYKDLYEATQRGQLEQAKEIEQLKREHQEFLTSIGFEPTDPDDDDIGINAADYYPRGGVEI